MRLVRAYGRRRVCSLVVGATYKVRVGSLLKLLLCAVTNTGICTGASAEEKPLGKQKAKSSIGRGGEGGVPAA